MDDEVRVAVEGAYQRCLLLIESKKDQVHLLAECLMEKETITNADVTRLLGPRPFAASKDYEDFLSAGTIGILLLYMLYVILTVCFFVVCMY